MQRILLVANSDLYIHTFRQPLIKALLEASLQTIVAVPEGPFTKKLGTLGCELQHFPFTRCSASPLNLFRAVMGLRKIICQTRPHIIQSFTHAANIISRLAQPGHIHTINSVAGMGQLFSNQTTTVRLSNHS